MTMIYEGKRTDRGCMVSYGMHGASRHPLPMRLDLFNHSPTGFEWGYEGSGPAQLALAILAKHCANGKRAIRMHQHFKRQVIANLPRDGWQMTSEFIDAAIADIETERGRPRP